MYHHGRFLVEAFKPNKVLHTGKQIAQLKADNAQHKLSKSKSQFLLDVGFTDPNNVL